MSETLICPECGGILATDDPRGLCARCLMKAALAVTAIGEALQGLEADQPQPAGVNVQESASRAPRMRASDALLSPASAGLTSRDFAHRVGALSYTEFERAVIDLGILDAGAISELGLTGPDSSGLARSLVQSGALTAYQACAIQQGKARGLLIGRYLILEKLGEGGMGVVFKARHCKLGRVVALKILPPSFARSPELVLRFRREAQAAARLDHPNVVSVFDADEDRGVYFLAMDYIEGHDLDHLIREHGPLTVGQALDCVSQAARGLEAAHAQGIIHRDIKPGNLMLDVLGIIRILDLGLARLVGSSSPFGTGQAADANLTRTGVYIGTVDFTAPEQAEDSSKADHRADIYSLGCSLYFLLTGRPPFEGATPLQRIMAHYDRPPPALRATRPLIPESLDAAYLAMMAKHPDDRPRSMAEVLALLESCRPAAPAVEPAATLESFSKAVAAHGARRRDDRESTIFIARDESGGFRFETDANGDQLHLEAGSDEPSRQLELAPPVEPVPSASPPRSAWRRSAGLAALASLVAVGALTFFFVLSRIGSESRSASNARLNNASAPPDAAPVANAAVLLDAAGSREATAPEPNHELAALESKTTPEPTRPDVAGGASTAVTPKVGRPPKRELAKVAAYDGAPVFTKHSAAVKTVVVARGGRIALSASQDWTARLWEVKTGKELVRPLRHPSEVLDATITADGLFALTATHGRPNTNGSLRLWNLATGNAVFRPQSDAHKGPIRAVTFAPNNRGLSGGQDGKLVLWNLVRGRPIGTLGHHEGFIHRHCIAVFPDGGRALTGGKDRLVHVWNLAARKETARWEGHNGQINDVAIAPDGRRAVTGSHDRSVILWDVATGSPLHRFTMPEGDNIPSVAILPGGNILAAGGVVGNLVLWDARTFSILRQAQPPFFPHGDLAVMPDGQRALTGDADGVVRLWTPRAP